MKVNLEGPTNKGEMAASDRLSHERTAVLRYRLDSGYYRSTDVLDRLARRLRQLAEITGRRDPGP